MARENFSPYPWLPRGFTYNTIYPFAARTCNSWKKLYAYCKCGPPWTSSSIGHFLFSSNSSGVKYHPWSLVPLLLSIQISFGLDNSSSFKIVWLLLNSTLGFGIDMFLPAGMVNVKRSKGLWGWDIISANLSTFWFALKVATSHLLSVIFSICPLLELMRKRLVVPSSPIMKYMYLLSGEMTGDSLNPCDPFISFKETFLVVASRSGIRSHACFFPSTGAIHMWWTQEDERPISPVWPE